MDNLISSSSKISGPVTGTGTGTGRDSGSVDDDGDDSGCGRNTLSCCGCVCGPNVGDSWDGCNVEPDGLYVGIISGAGIGTAPTPGGG